MQKTRERTGVSHVLTFIAGGCGFFWLLSWAMSDFFHAMPLTWLGAMLIFLAYPTYHAIKADPHE